ncbi:NAD(P)-binding protein [Mollisia scopiformis]|uniref:NAD(P)-binding protein n=1 Tax=Mollisia scopiformis TaxID=149040 RepID=A0A194X2P4_MOLSC|nr:NAD(P)-binding protein [Mollisia scopiformis]KUJ14107.1 NAD(P)-binding protein [Mollisia scopiformis]
MPPILKHHVLIVGGTSGIGFAVAELALASGCTVAIASSNPTRISSAIIRLQASFLDKKSLISGHEIDLQTPDIEARLTTLFDAVTSNKSKLLNHIVFTAGRIPKLKPLPEMDIISTLNLTQSSLSAPLALGKLAPPYLVPSYSSSITLTGGRVADKPLPNYTLFSFYASGLHGLVKSLAFDLAPIRVNMASPGATVTEMWGPEEVREMMAKKVGETALLGKVGSAEEVAEGYVYFMRDWNVTGEVLRSEGGAILQ